MPVNISVTDPISRAEKWTKRILFRPFDLGKWFAIGFCAWIAGIGGSGGSGGSSPRFGKGFSHPRQGGEEMRAFFERGMEWFLENFTIVVSVGALVFLLMASLWILMIWISSRGKFMFLDNVVRNMAEIKEPWNEFLPEGNSLTLFRLCFAVAGVGTLLLVGALSLPPFIGCIQAKSFLPLGLVGIFWAVLLFFLWILALGVVGTFLDDFVVPIMYLRRCSCTDAWREFLPWAKAYAGQFALFLLFKIVLGIGIGLLAMLAMVLTCCVAAIPFLGTVILLPLAVFMRSYTLSYLAQYHPEYDLLRGDTP